MASFQEQKWTPLVVNLIFVVFLCGWSFQGDQLKDFNNFFLITKAPLLKNIHQPLVSTKICFIVDVHK